MSHRLSLTIHATMTEILAAMGQAVLALVANAHDHPAVAVMWKMRHPIPLRMAAQAMAAPGKPCRISQRM